MGKITVGLQYYRVRELLRLIQDASELSGDYSTRKIFVLNSLLRTFDAQVAISCTLSNCLPHRRYNCVSLLDVGWPDPVQRSIAYSYFDGPRNSPVEQIVSLSAKQVTRTRQQIIADDEWYSSPHALEICRPAGIDHFICSVQRLPRSGWRSCLSVHRAWGDKRPFTRQDRALFHLLQLQFAKLNQTDPAYRAGEETGEQLTGRATVVLTHLLQGMSEKQIARQVNLSVHTVHTYVARLYTHYRVHSRAELLVACLKQPTG